MNNLPRLLTLPSSKGSDRWVNDIPSEQQQQVVNRYKKIAKSFTIVGTIYIIQK